MSNHKFVPALAALLLSAGLVSAQEAAAPEAEAPATEMEAATGGSDMSASGGAFRAQVEAADGTSHGTVTVQPTASGVSVVTLELENLPQGVVAVHLHETGACEGPDFKSAGGHLAMDGENHGVMAEGGPHVGDLPNLHVAEGGTAMVEHFVADLTPEVLDDEDGTGFIIHAKADDYESQPAGDAGDRIACGVLTRE
ncbi:superoxide dismutase family protein [Paracoccus sp. T5]|uniref:superoxide dismutase family protein n=1 Tax=Paracoccus sp. T5 TaxID=3402161 RepID=UPI003ADD39FC